MSNADPRDQHDFGIRFGWGPGAVPAICGTASASVIVDVLSFTTAVDIAVTRGAIVQPLPWKDERAAAAARERGAIVAGDRDASTRTTWSLSPTSLLDIPAGSRLALASPNGATVSAIAAEYCRNVTAGCLRNASAVAAAAAAAGPPVAVIAAGERWPDGQLRVAVEDLIGAGAIITALLAIGVDRPSPEARAAAAAHAAMAHDLEAALLDCVSGRELIARDFADDVRLAAQADVSTTVPRLEDGAFTAAREAA